jgi:hypothetical protein
MSRRLPFFVLLGAAGFVAIGCDDDTPATPATAVDAGQGGQDQGGDGGTNGADPSSPTPAPGPSVLGLSLPNFYAFVTGSKAIASSGLGFMEITTGPGTPVTDLDRAVFRLELNASAQGRKPGAIPVFVRSAIRPSPNVGFQAESGFICAQVRDGSSGRSYRTLQKTQADPMTNAPYPQNVDGCSWFLVEVESAGKKRYKPMILWNGEEAYLASTESDATTGRIAHFGATFSMAPFFQLLSAEHTGPIPQ